MGMQINLEKIKTLYELKRYNQCLKMCLKHLDLQSKYTLVLYSYALNCCLVLNDIKKAEELNKQALEKFPQNDVLYSVYARIYLAKLNYKKALEWIDKALALEAEYDNYYLVKAKILNNSEKFHEAKEQILKALKLSPKDPDNLYMYALILNNLNDKKFKKVLQEALSLNPHHDEALYFISLNNRNLREDKNLNNALKLNPFDKRYQKLYRANKRDFFIFIFSLLFSCLNVYFSYFLQVDKMILCLLNGVLILAILHLAFYTREVLLLSFLFVFASENDAKISFAFIVSLILAYVMALLLRYVKSSILLSFDALKNSLYFVKNSTKNEIKEHILSSKFDIFLYIIIYFLLLNLPKNFLIFSLACIMIVPFVIMLKKRVYTFWIFIHVFLSLIILRFISELILNFLSYVNLEFLHCFLMIFFAFIGVVISRRGN